MRVGVPRELNEAEGIEPGVSEAVARAVELLRELGAEVGDCELPRSVEYGLPCYYLIAPAEASSNLARYDGVRYGLRADGASLRELHEATRDAGFGDEPKRRIMLGTYALSAGYYDAYYGQAQKVRTLIRDEHAAAFERFDVLVSPDLAHGRLPARGTHRQPAGHVPLGPADDPLVPRRPAGPLDPVRPLGGPAGGAAARRAAVLREHALPRRPCARDGDRLRPGAGAAAGSGRVSTPAAAPPRTDWEPVIGLEIHVQLKTLTKMFCRCRVEYGAEPNSNTCPVCLAFPGALPVPNRRAIEWTVKLGLALGCDIAERALFHRKNYFYQDLPKGYQISQYDRPLCIGRRASRCRARTATSPSASCGRTSRRTRRRACTSAATAGASAARTTRWSTSTAAAPRSSRSSRGRISTRAEDAKRFLQLLRQTIVELGISDAEMEKGTLRADANVSVRPAGADELRTRTELKNMNSFTFIARGIEREIERQIEVWESGGEVVQQTFDFHPDTDRLTPRRQKEEADDYRYFPEPDLVPVEPAAELVEQLRAEVPELPGARIGRLSGVVGLETATGLVTGGRDRLFEAVVEAGAEPRAAANVLMNQFAGAGVEPVGGRPARAGRAHRGAATACRARPSLEALAASGDAGFRAERYLAEESVTDTGELEPIVERVLAANPGQVEQYRGGKQGLLGYFVGQVMKETRRQGGRARGQHDAALAARFVSPL